MDRSFRRVMDTGQYGNSVRRPEYGGGTFRASNSLRAKFARGQDAVAMRSCDIAYHPAQGKVRNAVQSGDC